MAKLFGQRPSDIALLDDYVGEIFRSIFDSGIAAFGQAVHAQMDKVATSSDPTIAQSQRQMEWERIMGGDIASAFRDLDDISPNARVAGRADEDDEMILDQNWSF